jgi:hypothetical protein
VSPGLDDDLASLFAGARRAAVVTLLVGLAVASLVVVLISLGADFVFGTHVGSPTMVIYVSVFAAIPLVVGLPVLIAAGARLHALRTLHRQPKRLVATGLAMRFGISIITGERDRAALAKAARARGLT